MTGHCQEPTPYSPTKNPAMFRYIDELQKSSISWCGKLGDWTCWVGGFLLEPFLGGLSLRPVLAKQRNLSCELVWKNVNLSNVWNSEYWNQIFGALSDRTGVLSLIVTCSFKPAPPSSIFYEKWLQIIGTRSKIISKYQSFIVFQLPKVVFWMARILSSNVCVKQCSSCRW